MTNRSIFLAFLFLGIGLNVSAQTSDLYYQLQKGFDANLNKMKSSLSSLEGSVNLNKRSRKKYHATALKQKTNALVSQLSLSYNRAQKIKDKLERHKNHNLAEKVGSLKSKIYSMKYTAEALSNYCQWMINKPKTHGKASFKRFVKAFNKLIEDRNTLTKKRKVLLEVTSWESYMSIKK